MKAQNEHLMTEWKELRDEIARKQAFVEKLIVTTVTGDLAIFSFVSIQQIPYPINAFLALVLPLILTTLSYFWIRRYFYSGARIARYIKETIEPHAGLGWEKWLSSIRRETEPDGKVKFNADIFGVFYHSLLALSLMVCLVLIWAPLWPLINSVSTLQSAQLSTVEVRSCAIFSGIAIVFWVIWHLTAHWTIITEVQRDTRKMMSAIQKPRSTEKRK